MTDAEAEAMLRALREHFREPVMPISRYCEGLQTWSNVSGIRMFDGQQGLMLRKSNLLWRMLYLGEKLRTVKCPTHHGRWSGYRPPGTCECQCGYDVTGWLP